MYFPIFLSVVLVVRNQSSTLRSILTHATHSITALVSDYELIIVDNASEDDSVALLKSLARSDDGLPNLQVYALAKEVDSDTASWVGLENALGDFVAVVDPVTDDLQFLPRMLEQAVKGVDIVLASNQKKSRPHFAYRLCFSLFNTLYTFFNDVPMARETPQYRVLGKHVVNFILQHPQPSFTYRYLPSTGGFSKVHLSYQAQRSDLPLAAPPKRLADSLDRGMRLLVSTTRAPMRLVTSLSLFGAVSNLLYSVYVIAIGIFKADVAPGWVTLSLQQSSMFLLISLVLLVLGEYILHMASLSNEGPPYHVTQEFTSAVMTRHAKLNIEEAPATRDA